MAGFYKSDVAEAMKRGGVTLDYIRFVTHTTRYNRDYWVRIDGLQRHFEHAEVDAVRDADKTTYMVTTKNESRLLLTDMGAAKKIAIDGDALTVESAASMTMQERGGGSSYGDYAILKVTKSDKQAATQIVESGVFDESWRMPGKW